jgi:hypothetical protein
VSRAEIKKVRRKPIVTSLNCNNPENVDVADPLHGFQAVNGIKVIAMTKPSPTLAVVGMSQLSFLFRNIACTRQSRARPATEISGRIEAQSALRGANNL